ncbi:MAG TPA: Imm74 family immunity protein, partial [Candidatus Paceibacterota bacterium]|nr:Imm74 family immunity protein [Candidatus Paceibacterota bacterium]
KRIRRWHGRWLLIAAVLGLSVGGSGQWADRRQQSFPPAIALPNGPSPGGSVALGSMGWAGNGRVNEDAPEAGLWPEAGAGGRYLSSLNLYETLPAAQADAIWARASQAYTARASGQIHLFIRGARPDRMFNTMERPLIKENQHLQTDLPLLNMFTRLGPNSAQSSEGFRVERTGRMELKYTEADRNLVVEVEPGEGLAIYRSSISGWNPPNESEALTDDDRQRIVRNICAALDFLQVPYVLA